MEESKTPAAEFVVSNYQLVQVLGDTFTAGLQQSDMSTFHELEPVYNMPSTSVTLPTLNLEEVMLSPELMDPQYIDVNLQVPYLQIIQQPQQEFRFRYESELTGTHGRLHGDSQTNRRNCYPMVELKGYDGPAVIRCTLTQNDSVNDIRPHGHCLVHKVNGDFVDDPHYKNVPGPKNYVTKWDGMGIVQTSQKHLAEKLIKKKTKLLKEKLARDLKRLEKLELEKQAKKEAKSIDLHVVYLRFDAFQIVNDIFVQLCPPVYSNSISNLKSARTNKLKIARMSTCSSPLSGGEEVFLLVEKLMKDDVKVRFFELNENDAVVWSENATIINVHYQTAIVIKTPAYKDQTADSQVRVLVELLRPSDGKTSDPLEFYYNPDPEVIRRKRRKVDVSTPSTSQSTFAIEEQSGETFNVDEMLKLWVNLPQDLYTNLTDPTMTLPEITTPFKIDSITAQMETFTTDDKNLSMITKTYTELIDLIKNRPLISELKMILEQHIKTTLYLAIESYGKIQDATNYVDLVLLFVKRLKLENELELNGRESLAHVAVKNRNYKLIERLQDFYSVQNCNGDTALHLSILLNDNTACKIIINNASIDFINLINNDGYTAVQLAVRLNNFEALVLLWESNADVLITDKQNGNTLLHIAIENNCMEIVKYLMEHIPIISTLENYNGLSCLALADSLGFIEIHATIFEKMEFFKIDEEIPLQNTLTDEILNEELLDSLLYIRIFTPKCLRKLITVLSEEEKWKRLVDLLGFSYILNMDLCNGPEEFINYALEHNVSIFDIRLSLLAMGESECVNCIDEMFSKE